MLDQLLKEVQKPIMKMKHDVEAGLLASQSNGKGAFKGRTGVPGNTFIGDNVSLEVSTFVKFKKIVG